jgi:hypothetical protein
MRKIPKAIYKTAKELQDEVEKRQTAISLLPDGEVKQQLVIQLAQLRVYAEMKQWARR